MKEQEMKEIINGTVVHCNLSGTGESKVLLLHGWGCDMKMMQPVASALEKDHRTLLIDFPGHGESGKPPEPWGVQEYAECVIKLLEKLQFIPCAVIAHSFGCRIAAWIEAYYPHMINRIVFTGAAGIRPLPSAESMKRTAKYKKLKRICGSMKNIPVFRSAAEKLENRLIRKYGSRDYIALDEEMRKTFVKVINQDLSSLYDRFQSSTLLIWGDADTETPLWMAKEMCRRIPDAGLVILENGTHFAYLEQIQRFNTIVCHFLKGDE